MPVASAVGRENDRDPIKQGHSDHSRQEERDRGASDATDASLSPETWAFRTLVMHPSGLVDSPSRQKTQKALPVLAVHGP